MGGEEKVEGGERVEDDVIDEEEVGEAGGCVVQRGAATRGGGWGVEGPEEVVTDSGEVSEALCAGFAGRYDD